MKQEMPPINVHYHATEVREEIDEAINLALKPFGYVWDSSGYEFDCGLRDILFTIHVDPGYDSKLPA